jgi:hypothetical protein
MDDRDEPQGRYYRLSIRAANSLNFTAWTCSERFLVSSREPDKDFRSDVLGLTVK